MEFQFDYVFPIITSTISFLFFLDRSIATLADFALGTHYICEVISVTFMYFGFLESDRFAKEKFLSIFAISWIWKGGSSTI